MPDVIGIIHSLASFLQSRQDNLSSITDSFISHSQDFHTDDRLIENQGHMHAGKIRCQVLFLISLILHNSSFSCE